jgi:alpha-beta hydrolase superfamily lysophospholipase
LQQTRIPFGSSEALLLGSKSQKVFLFLHGQGGSREEALPFAQHATSQGWQVLAIDLPGHGSRLQEASAFTPWEICPELQALYAYAQANWPTIGLRANSIGAWFAMLALAEVPLDRALFVSPIVDMPRLILRRMGQAGVSLSRLRQEQEIAIDPDQALSWPYFCYAQAHAITRWQTPTYLLSGAHDAISPIWEIQKFCARFGCHLHIETECEHWFHTPPQLQRLAAWEMECLQAPFLPPGYTQALL